MLPELRLRFNRWPGGFHDLEGSTCAHVSIKQKHRPDWPNLRCHCHSLCTPLLRGSRDKQTTWSLDSLVPSSSFKDCPGAARVAPDMPPRGNVGQTHLVVGRPHVTAHGPPLAPALVVLFFPPLFGCACSMWKFRGQGSNTCHSRDPSCCDDHVRFLVG